MNENDIWNEILRSVHNEQRKNENDEIKENATNLYSHLEAFMEAGFTREEAYGLLLTILEGAFNQ